MNTGDGIAMAGFLVAVGLVVSAVIFAATWLEVTRWRARSDTELAPPTGPAKSRLPVDVNAKTRRTR